MISLSSAELNGFIALFLWPFIRILALFSSAPILGHRSIPLRARIGLAIAVAIVVAPSVNSPGAESISGSQAIGILAQQLLIGFVTGFAFRLLFAAVELAGDLIGLQMGISFAGFIDPQHSGQTPLLGSFLVTLMSIVFLSLDGHLTMLSMLIQSFDQVPISSNLIGILRWESLSAMGSMVFSHGLQMALPVLSSMLAANIAMGILSRAAPALNIFSVGFPVTLLAGLALVTLLLPYIGGRFQLSATEMVRTLF